MNESIPACKIESDLYFKQYESAINICLLSLMSILADEYRINKNYKQTISQYFTFFSLEVYYSTDKNKLYKSTFNFD